MSVRARGETPQKRLAEQSVGWLLVAALLIVVGACGSEPMEEGSTSPVPGHLPAYGTHDAPAPNQSPMADALPLKEVRTWAYQLQGISEYGAVEALAATRYDMLVLEPTRTDWSSDDRYFDTRGMVSRLKASPSGDGLHRKLILAYVDIAEAEDWRWYWTWSRDWNCRGEPPDDWPDYILACDPDGWEGNFPVAYWDPAWKEALIHGTEMQAGTSRDYGSALDEVLKDGFDGIYLDWVEAFEDEDVMTAAQAGGVDPAREMIALIEELRAYALQRQPGFLVVQQNGAALVDGHPDLLDLIDGIAQEAIWYDGDATDHWDDPNGYDWENEGELTRYYLDDLQHYLDAGLPVFNCEYALDFADKAYSRSRAAGFIPYVTRRSLGRLTTTPPWGQ